MDIGYRDTIHLGFHYLLHRFFFFWPENVPLMQIQNLDDFLFFVFFLPLPWTLLGKKKTCIVLSLRDFSHVPVLALPHLDTE